MDVLMPFVPSLIGVVLAFALYRVVRTRTVIGRPILPAHGERLIPVFLIALLAFFAFDYTSGGMLSRADRFWVGIAVGAGLGALGITLIAGSRADGRRS
jgi:uncharacterized spore protein YtfJ